MCDNRRYTVQVPFYVLMQQVVAAHAFYRWLLRFEPNLRFALYLFTMFETSP